MAETLTYQTIKTANQAREAEELKTETRKKKLIILILHWLTEEGYGETAKSFEKETNLDLRKYDVCDNIDLDSVLQEYESYYYVRFNKYPRVIKKVMPTNISTKIAKTTSLNTRKTVTGSTVPVLPKVSSNNSTTNTNNNNNNHNSNTNSINVNNQSLNGSNTQLNGSNTASNNNGNNNNGQTRPTSVENKTYSVSSYINHRNESQHQSIAQHKSLNGSQTNLVAQNTNSINDTQNSKKIKNIVFERNGYTNNAESIEEFGLSVTKIDNTKQANGFSNVNTNQATNVQRKKYGPIIDYRAMINEATKLNSEDSNMDPSDRLMKPLAGYIGYNSEWRELAQVISRDIYMNNPDVKWDDIIGLDAAKRTIKEAVVYPIKYPQLFTGILSPWKGLLLYGPPGTGKTLLAKAVATECNTTFFNISASTIVSKWRGDSEKLVRVLFEMARFYAPSTIFMDELESIMSIRGSQGGGGEHEGSRRMKTELLVQMDGLAKSDDLVFLLAASNIPWELDHAMLRRLEKRIIVDLPTHEARKRMFQHHLPHTVIEEPNGLLLGADLDYDKLAELTDGYSGSDIQLVCKEAAMRSVRKVFAILENLDESIQEVGQLKLDKISTEDVKRVLLSTKPSARQYANKYEAWTKEYESV